MKKDMHKWVTAAVAAALILSACGKEGANAEGQTPSIFEKQEEIVSEEPAVSEKPVTEEQQTASADEQAQETASEIADSDVCIIKVNGEDTKFTYKPLTDGKAGYSLRMGTCPGKAFFFYDKFTPDETFGSYAFNLGIVDLNTLEYAEVPVESTFKDLCVDKNPGVGVAEDDEDIMCAGPMDEESGHLYLDYFWDNDEFSGVYIKEHGMDTEGNIFALNEYSGVYKTEDKLYNEEDQYEILKWTTDGEPILPTKTFKSDELDSVLEGLTISEFEYGSRFYVQEGNLKGAELRNPVWIDDNSFVAFYSSDGGIVDFYVGLFTKSE